MAAEPHPCSAVFVDSNGEVWADDQVIAAALAVLVDHPAMVHDEHADRERACPKTRMVDAAESMREVTRFRLSWLPRLPLPTSRAWSPSTRLRDYAAVWGDLATMAQQVCLCADRQRRVAGPRL